MKLKDTGSRRFWYVAQAMRAGMSIEEIYERTAIDPWFLNHMKQMVEMEEEN